MLGKKVHYGSVSLKLFKWIKISQSFVFLTVVMQASTHKHEMTEDMTAQTI